MTLRTVRLSFIPSARSRPVSKEGSLSFLACYKRSHITVCPISSPYKNQWNYEREREREREREISNYNIHCTQYFATYWEWSVQLWDHPAWEKEAYRNILNTGHNQVVCNNLISVCRCEATGLWFLEYHRVSSLLCYSRPHNHPLHWRTLTQNSQQPWFENGHRLKRNQREVSIVMFSKINKVNLFWNRSLLITHTIPQLL